MRHYLKKKVAACNADILRKLFPILVWLPKYNIAFLKADLIASLAVGLMVVPQSLALASLAELPTETGLYTAFPGGFVYCLLGTSKDLTIGPTVVASMVTDRYNVFGTPFAASTLAFLTGVVLIAMGIFKLGFLVQFLPSTVIGGFVSAAAIVIMIGQLKYIFGLKNAPRFFFDRLVHFFKNVQHTNKWDVTLGLTCLVILVSLQIISKGKWRQNKPKSVTKKVLKMLLVSLIIARSALIVALATLISYIFHAHGYKDSFTLAGHLPPGLPKPQIPVGRSVMHSMNVTKVITSVDVIHKFGVGTIIVPFILLIESIAVAKALARKNKYSINPTQELLALGMSNVLGSFFGAFPMTASFSRTAVNSMSGVATPLSGVFTSIIVIMAIQFITPVFRFIPMAALGAMVFAAVMTMIEVSLPKKVWMINKPDLLLVMVSFLGCFYEIEVGILAGAGVGIGLILYRANKPRITVIREAETGTVTLQLKGGVCFLATEAISNSITSAISTIEKTVIIDLQHVFEMDFSVVQCLRQASLDLKTRDGELRFININSEHVLHILRKSKLICHDNEENENSEINALLESDHITRTVFETVV